MPGVHPLLDAGRLDEIEQTAAGPDPRDDELVEALGDLLDHRDDDLVHVGSFVIRNAMPRRLVAFRARDPERTALFLVASDDGELLLGRCDELPRDERAPLPNGWVRRRLDGFDEGTDEIVTMVISRWLRPVGDRLDLWVMSRSWRTPTEPVLRCHHALVGIEDGKLTLAPAHDDRGAPPSNRIRAEKMSAEFPAWLRHEHFVAALSQDPFAARVTLPSLDANELIDTGIRRALRAFTDEPTQSVEVTPVDPASAETLTVDTATGARITHTAWSTRRVVHGDAHGRLSVYSTGDPTEFGYKHEIDLGAPVRGLALAESSEASPRCWVVAGTGDHALLCHQVSDLTLIPFWQQRMPDESTALAWLPRMPGASNDEAPEALLVAFRDGRVEQARYVGHARIEDVWRRLVERLAPAALSPAALVERIEGLLPLPPEKAAPPSPARAGWRRALLMVLAERMMPAPRAFLASTPLRDRIVRLFEAHPTAAAPRAALDRLVAHLATRRQSDGLSALIYEIYAAAPIAVREHLDARLRGYRDDKLGPLGEEDWRLLMKRCGRCRRELLNDPEVAPEVKALVAVEGWANLFVESETFRVTYDEPAASATVPPFARLAVGPTGPGESASPSWIAVGLRTRIGLHGLSADPNASRGLRLDRTARCFWPTSDISRDDLLVDLCGATYAGRPCLALAWRSGLIEILEPTPGPTGWRWNLRAGWTERARPIAIEALDGHLFIGCRDRRYSSLVVRRLADGASVERHSLPDSPRLSLIRVAARRVSGQPAGFWLFASSANRTAPRLLALDDSGCPVGSSTLRSMRAPVTAAAFDDRRNPTTLAVGTRDGMVYGEDIGSLRAPGEPVAATPAWLYHTIGLPRSITGIPRVDGEATGFLIGAARGRLTAVDARSGARRWGHRLTTGLRHLVAAPSSLPSPFVLISQDDGRVMLLERSFPTTFDEVNKRVCALPPTTGDASSSQLEDADRESVDALRRILTARTASDAMNALAAAFATARHREARGRLIRYLARERQDDPELGLRRQLCAAMNHRERQLLLTLLPSDRRGGWLDLLRLGLYGVSADEPAGDDGIDAQQAAVATLLAHGGLNREGALNPQARRRALDALPPPEYFTHRWVGLEVARHLLLTTTTATSKVSAQLPPLLDALLRVPVEVVADVEALLPLDHPLHAGIAALARVADNARDEAESFGLEAVARLGEALVPSDLEEGVDEADESARETTRFLLSLLALHRQLTGDAARGPWAPRREPIFAALRALGRRLRGRPPPLLTRFSLALSRMVPPDPPVGQARLTDRRKWVDALRRALAVADPAAETALDDWEKFARALLGWTRRRLEKLAILEDRELRELVRPHLTLRRGFIDVYGRVELVVAVEGEGSVELSDATLTLSVDDPETGLEGAHPSRVKTWQSSLYPTLFTRAQHCFQGTLPGARTTVKIRARLSGRHGASPAQTYEHEEWWAFVLERASDGARPAPLPHQLPQSFERMIGWITRPGAPSLQVLVTTPVVSGLAPDDRVPADAFARELVLHHGGAWLDLDRDGWPGGEHHRGLDALGARQTDGLNVITADRWLARLLLTERHDIIDTWLDVLTDLARGSSPPRLIWTVAAEHVQAISRRRPDAFLGFDRIEAYRLDACAAHASTFDERARHEQRQWQREQCAGAQLPDDALASDLRYFTEWCRWRFPAANTQAGEATAPHLFEAIRQLVLADLAALPSRQRLAVLAIAQSNVDLIAPHDELATGMMLARPIEWPERGGNTRRAAGHALTASDARALRTARITIRVEGYAPLQGLRGVLSRLPSLLAGWPGQSGEPIEPELEALITAGLATRAGPMLRLRSPYREVIQALYATQAAPPEEDRDQRVYAALYGAGRSLVECLALNTLRRMSEDHQATILPRVPAHQRAALLRVARWVEEPLATAAVLADAFGSLFGAPATPLREAADAVDGPLRGFAGLMLFGLGPPLPDKACADYLGWVRDDTAPSAEAIGRALELVAGRIAARADGNRRTPLLMLIGPGTEGIADDIHRRFATLRLTDLHRACTQGDLGEALRRQARGRMRHTHFSPFKVSGALPPGSPLFVGRTEELDHIRENIARQSCLIVGARRIGKTSLLNQVMHWLATAQPLAGELRMVPILVDCASIRSGAHFARQVAFETRRRVPQTGQTDPELIIRAIVQHHHDRGELPVFLLNEIDGLDARDPTFVAFLRGLDGRGDARFVCVAYASGLKVRRVDASFFNFTHGMHFTGRATYLTALTEEAALALLDRLEAPPLALAWRSLEERRVGRQRLVEQSYHIPWVLQHLGDSLVRRLETQGRESISDDDVRHVLRDAGPLVWRYFEEIDFKHLGFDAATDAHGPGMKLVLYAVARERYFLGGAAVRRRDLTHRSTHEFSFTVGEARHIVGDTVGRLLVGAQRTRVLRWFRDLDLDEALRLLTLTLALEPVATSGDHYAFLLHALPLELERQHGRDDPLLDGLIIKTAVEFLNNLQEET